MEPGPEQRRVLETVYGPFATSATWPKYQYVDKELDAAGHDLAAALADMPAGLLKPDPRWPGHVLQPGDDIALTLAGLAAVGAAAADVDLFMRFLRLIVARERDFRPASPSAAEEVAISSAEVATALNLDQLEVRKLWAFVHVEPLLGSGGGEPDRWHYEIRGNVRLFRDAYVVADYLRLRPDPSRLGLASGAASVGRSRLGTLDAVLRHPLIVTVGGGLVVAALLVWFGLK